MAWNSYELGVSHFDTNRCAGSRPGADLQFTARQGCALPHAGYPDSPAAAGGGSRKTDAVVANFECQLSREEFQVHPGLAGAGVFRYVPQRFLCNPEQAQSDLRTNRCRVGVMVKSQLDLFSLRELLAEALQGGNQSQVLQRRGVKLVRHAPHIPGQFLGLLAKPQQIFANRSRNRRILRQRSQFDYQQSQLLIDHVMKFPGNPSALAFLYLQKLSCQPSIARSPFWIVLPDACTDPRIRETGRGFPNVYFTAYEQGTPIADFRTLHKQ